MDADNITGLKAITDALAEHALRDFKTARQAERGLRDELDEISRLRKEALSWTEQAHLGFDARWTVFLDQRRATLNVELAQNLARQAPLQHAAALAVARQKAVSDLKEKACADAAFQRQKRAEQALMDLAVLRSSDLG